MGDGGVERMRLGRDVLARVSSSAIASPLLASSPPTSSVLVGLLALGYERWLVTY
jgi:hypothetical protein